jgi:lactate dehydrogenase-like 2-hydroxyacid dehydrogenase
MYVSWLSIAQATWLSRASQAEVLITTPFHPGYLTADIMEKAKNLKLCITAGVGSDHIDLNAATKHGVQVLEASWNGDHIITDLPIQK